MSSHEELRALAGGYALGILTEEERDLFEAHLAVCAECVTEVRQMLDVVEALGPAIPAGTAAAMPPGPVHRPDAQPGARGSLRSFFGTPWRTAAVALLALAAIVLGIIGVRQRQEVGRLRESLRAAQARTADIEQKLEEVRGALIGATPLTTEILAASDLAPIRLSGVGNAAEAGGHVFWSDSLGWVFVATDLPPLPPGLVYQLWIITAERPISAGLLSPDPQGRAEIVHRVDNALRPRAVAVTAEPAGGVPAPTGPKCLVGTL